MSGDSARRRLPLQPRVHRRPYVRELALADLPEAFLPATYATSIAYSREWSVDGVVGSQPWSDATISAAWAQRLEEVGQPPVEVLQAPVKVLRVVPVAPERVGLDEVREDEPLVQLL